MHMKAFVTLFHADLDGTTRLVSIFRTRKHSWNLFQQNRTNLLIKSKSFGKLRRIKKFEHNVLMHAGQNLFLCVGLLAENYVLDRM